MPEPEGSWNQGNQNMTEEDIAKLLKAAETAKDQDFKDIWLRKAEQARTLKEMVNDESIYDRRSSVN